MVQSTSRHEDCVVMLADRSCLKRNAVVDLSYRSTSRTNYKSDIIKGVPYNEKVTTLMDNAIVQSSPNFFACSSHRLLLRFTFTIFREQTYKTQQQPLHDTSHRLWSQPDRRRINWAKHITIANTTSWLSGFDETLLFSSNFKATIFISRSWRRQEQIFHAYARVGKLATLGFVCDHF